MSKQLTALEVDVITGEQTIRPLTVEEIADRQEIATNLEAQQAEAQAKADARESALAKLAALGLTQDEINAL
jgi:DNA-binding NarL/FixJ family response regulator